MPPRSVVPQGEDLRRAVAWLIEQGEWTPQRIDEACRRFDLSPLDEEFLFAEFRRFHPRPEP